MKSVFKLFSGTQTHLKTSKKGFIFHTHSALFCIQIEKIHPKSPKSKVFSFDFKPFPQNTKLTDTQVQLFRKSCIFNSKMSHWGMKALSMACVSAYDGLWESLYYFKRFLADIGKKCYICTWNRLSNLPITKRRWSIYQ